MQIQVSQSDSTPFYAQVVGQIRFLIASGRLDSGDQLPAIRQLAEQLTLNPNTIARAYRELEREGVVVAKRGAGVFVSSNASPLSRKEKLRLVCEHVDSLLISGRQLGLDVETLLRLVKQRNKEL